MSREFDVIVYGATGYTGRLVAEYLAKTYGVGRDLAWAMAGRSEAKLAQVRDEIGAPASTPFVVADAAATASVTAMAKRTKVICTTVGPYQLHGDALVAACAAEGTDYVDLTGESNWIAAKIAQLEGQAKASGARITFSCGFDSIPFDLGVMFTQNAAKAKFGQVAPRVRGRLRAMRGGASGGTLASGAATMAAMQKDPSIMQLLMDPFALTPGFRGPQQPDLNSVYEDKVTGSWVAPFIMAGINTKAVHRSNFLMGHPWGKDFLYDEMMMIQGPTPPPGAGFDMSGALKPGEGPTKAEREAGFYDVLFIAEMADGRALRASVKGDMDPGYGSTSKMLAESAVCLAKDISRERTPGGCWTSASAMGETLIARLERNAGLTFAVEG
jgi:short subunit dehydrogenase-like uncharacterized protein